MTDSQTTKLRKLLDERGVEYETDDGRFAKVTKWLALNGRLAVFAEYDSEELRFAMDSLSLTPEQAIAATLGNGTCRNEWAEFGKFRCSECWTQVDAISTNTTQPMPIKFCPNCGRQVER